MKLILASGSATRQTMLRHAGLEFSAIAPAVDEAAFAAANNLPPAALAAQLATAKAASVAGLAPKALTIGADQVLVLNGRIFSKPGSMAEAAQHLQALAGQTHSLISAVCVHQGGAEIWRHTDSARLTMRALSDAEIAAYLAAAGPKILGCVGAYQLEGLGSNLFSETAGDFFTILGLPLLPLLGFLRGHAAARPAVG